MLVPHPRPHAFPCCLLGDSQAWGAQSTNGWDAVPRAGGPSMQLGASLEEQGLGGKLGRAVPGPGCGLFTRMQ